MGLKIPNWEGKRIHKRLESCKRKVLNMRHSPAWTSKLVNYIYFRGYFHKRLQNKGYQGLLAFKSVPQVGKLQAKLQHPFQFGRRCGVLYPHCASTFSDIWKTSWSFSDWQNLQRYEDSVEVLYTSSLTKLPFVFLTSFASLFIWELSQNLFQAPEVRRRWHVAETSCD